jgi:hypothetical protein
MAHRKRVPSFPRCGYRHLVDEKGGDDALHALYAPPAPGGNGPLPGSRKRFARAAFGAAFRTQRRALPKALLLLGVLPGLWSLPADLLMRGAPADVAPFDWAAQTRGVGIALLDALWDAVWMGGQTLVALELARSGSASIRDLLRGVRFTPAMFLLGALLVFWLQLVSMLPAGAEELGDAGVALVLPLLFLMLAVIVPPCSLASYELVDRRRGLLDALTRTIALLRDEWWGYLRLGLLTMGCYLPGLLLVDDVYLSTALSSLIGPTVGLAWAHAYLRSTAERSPADAGPSVAAQPRP